MVMVCFVVGKLILRALETATATGSTVKDFHEVSTLVPEGSDRIVMNDTGLHCVIHKFHLAVGHRYFRELLRSGSQ